MAGLGEVTIKLTEDIATELQKVGDELRATKEACDEARIRQIVREELEAWEQRQLEALKGLTMGEMPTLRLFTDRSGSRSSRHAPSDQHAEAIVSPLARVEE